jgi:hypothetical protein
VLFDEIAIAGEQLHQPRDDRVEHAIELVTVRCGSE